MVKSILVLLVFLTSSNSFAEISFPKKLDYLLSASTIEDGFSGVIRVQKGRYTLYEKSVGFANIEHDVPNKQETKFLIASVSKQFTAALILKLAEQGALSIDDLVSQYFPLNEEQQKIAPSYWNEIKIRHLLSHTAGMIRDVPMTLQNPRSQRNHISTLVSATLDHSKSFQREQKLGVDFSYSNTGYVFLAAIAEQTCGKSFEKCLEEKILKPLDLENTGIYHRMKILKNQAEGYSHTDNSSKLHRRCCLDATNLIGSHSMYSDALDLTTWNQFLNGKEESTILSLESRQLLKTMSVKNLKDYRIPNPEAGYGFGLFIDDAIGSPRIWHDGNTSGYLSLVAYFPEKDISVVILNNYHGVFLSTEDFYNLRLFNLISKEIVSTYPDIKIH